MNFAPDTPLESFLRETFLPQHCRSRAYSYNYIAAARWLQRHLRRPPMLADLNAPTLTAFLADAAAMGASKKRVVTLKRSFIWLWRCAGELDLCPACPIPRGCRQASLPRPEGKPGTLVDLFNKRYQPENLADCEDDRELAYFGIFRAMRNCFHRDLRIKELSPAVVAKYLAYLKDKGRSSGTLKGHRCRILTLWRFAYRCGLIKHEPAVRPIKILRETPDAWSLDEVVRIIAAAGQVKRKRLMGGIEASLLWPAMLLVVYYTAIRRKTLWRLSPGDVDLDSGVLTVPARLMKNRCGQKFRLGSDAIAALRRILNPSRERLFPVHLSRANDRHVYAAFRAILKAAGVKGRGPNKLSYFHKMRRTAVTHTAARAGLAAAIALAGHSGPEITARYIDPTYLSQNDATAWLPVVGAQDVPRLEWAGASAGKDGAA